MDIPDVRQPQEPGSVPPAPGTPAPGTLAGNADSTPPSVRLPLAQRRGIHSWYPTAPYILWTTTFLHLAYAACITVDAEALLVTPLFLVASLPDAIINTWFPALCGAWHIGWIQSLARQTCVEDVFVLPQHWLQLGCIVIYFLSSALAIFTMRYATKRYQVCIGITPQQCLLLLAASGNTLAVWAGHFGNAAWGGRAVVIASNLPGFLFALTHSIVLYTIILRGWDTRGRRSP